MSRRSIYLLGLILICLLLAASIYLQVVDGIMPCPLCILQRFTFVLLGAFFLIGLFVSKYWLGRCIINPLLLLTSLLGIGLSGRQIWLQHYSDPDRASCGVSLEYMLQVLPFDQVMQKVLEGSAECTQRGWEFLYLDMAEWSLAWFGFFFLMSLFLLMKKGPH